MAGSDRFSWILRAVPPRNVYTLSQLAPESYVAIRSGPNSEMAYAEIKSLIGITGASFLRTFVAIVTLKSKMAENYLNTRPL